MKRALILLFLVLAPGLLRAEINSVETIPGGSNTQVQFNDSLMFGGDADFTYDKTGNRVTVPSMTVTNVEASTVNVRYKLEAGSFTTHGLATADTGFVGDGSRLTNLLVSGLSGASTTYASFFATAQSTAALFLTISNTNYMTISGSTQTKVGGLNLQGALTVESGSMTVSGSNAAIFINSTRVVTTSDLSVATSAIPIGGSGGASSTSVSIGLRISTSATPLVYNVYAAKLGIMGSYKTDFSTTCDLTKTGPGGVLSGVNLGQNRFVHLFAITDDLGSTFGVFATSGNYQQLSTTTIPASFSKSTYLGTVSTQSAAGLSGHSFVVGKIAGYTSRALAASDSALTSLDVDFSLLVPTNSVSTTLMLDFDQNSSDGAVAIGITPYGKVGASDANACGDLRVYGTNGFPHMAPWKITWPTPTKTVNFFDCFGRVQDIKIYVEQSEVE